MIVTCEDHSGFEDQLTSSQRYVVEELGENSYLLVNDAGQRRWYGVSHFFLTLY